MTPILKAAACAAALIALVSGCAQRAGSADAAQIVLRGQERLDFGAWLDRLAVDEVDVVFLGERHDNESHHALQAAATAGLDQRFAAAGGVAGLVFEMISFADEEKVLKTRGWPEAAGPARSQAVGPAIGWAESGWPDFALYAPIMEAAPSAYLAGGGYPRRALFKAVTGPDWLSREPGAARFGLDAALPAAQQAEREAKQIRSHCDAIPAEVAPRMVEAQRARDARLASAVLRARAAARAQGRRGPIVVIAGAGHARKDYGAPAMLARAAPALRVEALTFVEAAPSYRPSAAETARFDAFAPTPGPLKARGDPCAAFKKRPS